MTAQPVAVPSDPGTSIADLGTLVPMRAVMLEVPESLLAERRRLGHDRFDEMWEGVLHMVPAPNFSHQSLESKLCARWLPLAEAVGLDVVVETGLYDPAVPGHSSYRVPDLTVFDPVIGLGRGIEGAAHLVVEIRSPNDESFEKLPYYERLGVREVLILDPAIGSIRHWSNGPQGLVESLPAIDGVVALLCLPVTLEVVDGALRMHAVGIATDLPFGA